ncbi:tigger transposable element-derived protein 1-like [Macrobrachium rosenbergii]|uniref:tigger transposable element-derived protein 1-like n=1 Tax=Macrobrachium rosenbergii TaxID=79674 RepID=UPI0034D4DE7F
MAPKWQNASSDASALKKRKRITMEVKYNVIKHSEKGESHTEIGHALGLSRTTVVTIVKDKQRILKHVQDAALMKVTVMNVKQRSQNIVEMEKLLLIWLENQNQQRVPVSPSVIQEKARELHTAAVRKNGEGSASEEFTANRGWFNSFKACANLYKVKLLVLIAWQQKVFLVVWLK